MAEKTRPDCYKCCYRAKVIGSAHSFCTHPALLVQAGADQLGIQAYYYGIKQGWFNFPYNFDPVWLEACNGFTPLEPKETQ